MDTTSKVRLNTLQTGLQTAVVRKVILQDGNFNGTPCQLLKIRLEVGEETISNYIPIDDKYAKKLAFIGHAMGMDGEFAVEDLLAVQDVPVVVKLVEHHSLPGKMIAVEWFRAVEDEPNG